MKLRTNSTNHQHYDYEVTPLSRYSDMIWDLTPLLHDKRSSVYSLGRLNFNLLASKPLLIDPFKHFFYLRLAHCQTRNPRERIRIFVRKNNRFHGRRESLLISAIQYSSFYEI